MSAYNKNFNKDNTIVRYIIVSLLHELNNSIYYYIEQDEEKPVKVNIPFFFGNIDQRFLSDAFIDDQENTAIGNYERVPRGVIQTDSVTIDSSSQTNKFIPKTFTREWEGRNKTFELSTNLIPLSLNFSVTVTCSNYLEILKANEAIISKFYKNKFLYVDLGMFNIPSSVSLPEDYSQTKSIDFSSLERKEFNITFDLEVKSFLPVFENGILLSEIDLITKYSVKNPESSGVGVFRTNEEGELGIYFGNKFEKFEFQTNHKNLIDYKSILNEDLYKISRNEVLKGEGECLSDGVSSPSSSILNLEQRISILEQDDGVNEEEIQEIINNSLTSYVSITFLNNALTNYVTDTDLTNTLADYSTSSEVTNEINTALTDYVTDTDLTNTLADYSTSSEVTNEINTALTDYVTNTDLTTELNNYVTNTHLTDNYSTSSEVTDDINNAIQGLATQSDLDNLDDELEQLSNEKIALFRHVKDQGVGGGDLSPTPIVVPINDEVYNDISNYVSFDTESHTFIIQPGNYAIRAIIPAYSCGEFRAAFYDVNTDNVIFRPQTGGNSFSDDNQRGSGYIWGILTAENEIEIVLKQESSKNSLVFGMGKPTSLCQEEEYHRIEIQRLNPNSTVDYTNPIDELPSYVNQYSLEFPDNNGDYFTANFSSTLSISTPFSWIFWIKKTLIDGNFSDILDIGDFNGANGFAIRLNNINIDFRISNGPGTRAFINFASTPNSDGWRQIAITYDGSGDLSGVHLYNNGNKYNSTLTGTFTTFDVNNSTIGKWIGLASSNFLLDHMEIHNIKLLDEEINTKYNEGTPFEPLEESLIHYYNFDDNNRTSDIEDLKGGVNLIPVHTMQTSDYSTDVP